MTKAIVYGLAVSGALHVGAFTALEQPFSGIHAQPPSTTVWFNVAPNEPPEPIVPQTPALPDEPVPKSRPRPHANEPRAAKPPKPQETSDARASDEPIADLTGITLTNPAGAGWSSIVGDGSSRAGPLRIQRRGTMARAPTVASQKVLRRAPSQPAAPRVLPAADLSAPPRPPNLDGSLETNYPESARAAGLSGLAVVRALISPTGVARVLGIVSESAPGFGNACLRTVTGSVWSAPIDRDGRAVSTEIQYRCRFRVRH